MQTPITLKAVLADESKLGYLGSAPVLAVIYNGREVVLTHGTNSDCASAPAPTMVFLHETIDMMKTDRAAQLDLLAVNMVPEAQLLPLAKRTDGFWANITLGRTNTADIVLNDPAVSNMHAHFILEEHDESVLLQDVDSSNGTYLNRQRLQPHQRVSVNTGDCLRFGQTVTYLIKSSALPVVLAFARRRRAARKQQR